MRDHAPANFQTSGCTIGDTACLCCGGNKTVSENTLVSAYFSYKAFSSSPSPCLLVHCLSCGFKFYNRRITDEEGSAYYSGYRDEKYFIERHHYEPFYTRSVHDGLSEHMCSSARRDTVAAALRKSGASNHFNSIIDYGGGDGALITDLPAERRISFDPSGTPGQPGIEVVDNRASLPPAVDLVICAQVLEHVSDPKALVSDMVSLLRPGGLVYLEVPDQSWRRFTSLRPSRAFFEWLSRHPRMLLAADIFSTFFRVKLGTLPPFGFVPMREHINFFSASALRAIAMTDTLVVRAEGYTSDKSFWLVSEKCR